VSTYVSYPYHNIIWIHQKEYFFQTNLNTKHITMKVSAILILALIASVSHALVASDRRTFLVKASTASAAAFVAAANPSPAFAKDEYSMEVDQVVVPKKEMAKKKGGNGGLLVGGALFGGLALSLPFFAPNLARMAGVKNTKLPK
jgi:hypothetical protein